jgi:phosphoenolpyruvate-protein kinase (PTS system EI component)
MASRRVIAPVRRVKDAADNELAGCIVCIRSADPGFDWIFSRGIAGLITAYGGANSHMAIRAEELRVPAAIGVGEQAFDKYASADRLELDPLNRHIRIIS